MKDSEKFDAGQESNEVELSAQDLFALSPPVMEAPASPIAASTFETRHEETESPPSASLQRAPRARRTSVAAVVLTVGAVAAAAAAVAVIVPKDRQSAPMQTALTPQPAPVEEPAPLEVEGPPVLFKNPFDATEVFEFPPGTSREEARAAVADLLIMRAQERQALLDSQSKKRR